MDDRDQRIVSGLNTTYLSEEALADIERLGLTLAEGEPLTFCDYDAESKGIRQGSLPRAWRTTTLNAKRASVVFDGRRSMGAAHVTPNAVTD